MRTHLERTVRGPTWIAGISICLLAAAGIVAIVRSIPASYAGIQDEGVLSARAAAPSPSDDANSKDTLAHPAPAVSSINRRSRTGCRECGVIESMRRIEGVSDVSGQHKVDVEFVAGAVSGGAIASNAAGGHGYEFTVRFPDGSTMVFNEATSRTWRPGGRVVVIGGSNALKS